MANTNFLTVAELDVAANKESLREFLKGNPLFKDYNFEASNLSALIDVLAFNTFNNAFYLNMQGNETFMDSVTLKEPAVSRAKELNYVPRSRNSSVAVVNVSITTSNSAVSTITIPKNFYFTAIDPSKIVLFSTAESIVVRNEGGAFTAPMINIYEGRIVTEYFTVANSASYPLASANVDISSLYVTVQASNTDTTTSVYSRAYNLFGLTPDSLVYFVEGYKANNYQVVFGNDTTGKALDTGNIVKVQYRECSGADVGGFTVFRPASFIVDNDGNVFNNITVSAFVAAIGGAERESIDSIKFNAPRHYSAQDRAITKNDFTVLLKSNFPTIQAISVFGGEELQQKRYGKVIVATKPFGQEITPSNIKTQMAAFLAQRMGVTFDPIFVDPDYFYVDIDSTISYDPTATTRTTFDIASLARGAINSYHTTNLFDFNSDLRLSKLIAAIDNSDISIVSNDTDIRMIKRLTPIADFAYSTSVDFENALNRESTLATVETSVFDYIHTDGVLYFASLKDDGNGTLNIYDSGGALLVRGIGTVNYVTGNVSISNLTVHDYTGHINLYVRLSAKDIIINRSQIISIDQADVSVNVIQAPQ